MADSLLISSLKRFDSSATVEQVIAQLKQENEEAEKRAFDKEVLKQQWYENCVGKYFLIRHNDRSFCVVYIRREDFWKYTNYTLANNDCVDVYSVLLSDERDTKRDTKTAVTHNEGFNKYWMGNPYDDNFDKSKPATEIQKLLFDEIANLYCDLMTRAESVYKNICC